MGSDALWLRNVTPSGVSLKYFHSKIFQVWSPKIIIFPIFSPSFLLALCYIIKDTLETQHYKSNGLMIFYLDINSANSGMTFYFILSKSLSGQLNVVKLDLKANLCYAMSKVQCLLLKSHFAMLTDSLDTNHRFFYAILEKTLTSVLQLAVLLLLTESCTLD